MPVERITEQQFRTRRRDRRMIWVDLAAFLVGLIVLSASVGALIYVEPEQEPFEWRYSWFEARDAQKLCAGFAGVDEGCTKVVENFAQPEGDQVVSVLFDPVVLANVTTVSLRLSWIDDTPITESPGCTSDCGKKFSYNENSTDLLRLTVVSPSGESFTAEAFNDVETRLGEIRLQFNYTALPAEGILEAFTADAATALLPPEHWVTEHAALGAWSASVQVVRAGDQNGTAPTNACDQGPMPIGPFVPEGLPREADCNLHDNQDNLESSTAAASDIRGATPYESSYEDRGQTWILEFNVRYYEAVVSF